MLVIALPVRELSARGANPTGEVRGLWVQRATLTSAKSIQQMVETARRAGFNTLLVEVRSRGEAMYESHIEPRARELDDAPAGFDPLAMTLATAHAAGLKVHAWFNVGVVSSAASLPRVREHVVARHPEWLMVPRRAATVLRTMPPDIPIYVGEIARAARADSGRIAGVYLSPVSAAAREYTTSVVRDLVSRYAIDGVHFDALQFPSDQFDYSSATLSAFRADVAPTLPADMRERLDRLAKAKVGAWADGLPEAWSRFRQAKLTALLASLQAVVRKARPGVVLSAAVTPDADEARTQRLQDWRGWASRRLLDVLCPMVDQAEASAFSAELARANRDSAGVPVWAGIGTFRLTAERAADHVKVARRSGVSGVLLFSYDTLAALDGPADFFEPIRPVLLDDISTARRQ